MFGQDVSRDTIVSVVLQETYQFNVSDMPSAPPSTKAIRAVICQVSRLLPLQSG